MRLKDDSSIKDLTISEINAMARKDLIKAGMISEKSFEEESEQRCKKCFKLFERILEEELEQRCKKCEEQFERILGKRKMIRIEKEVSDDKRIIGTKIAL